MPTSYTSLLGFALPVTGEVNGTWGDVVNDSITQLVEDSVAGTATASVASGDWTLTTTGSGAANQARCAILIPTGSPGTTRNIIAPSSSKAYIVDNQSDSIVVLKGSATTGVSIAASSKALCAWNGTDFVQVGGGGGGGIAAGTIVSFQTSESETDYIICNGAPITKASYPALTGVLQDYIGITATTVTAGGTSVNFSIPYNGTVMCSVLGNTSASTTAITSPDGITWTARTLPVSSKWMAVAWNGTVFAAVSAFNTVGTVAATSPDGITWTQRTLPVSTYWSNIAAKGSTFCAIAGINGGSTNIAATSTDGITWTQQTLPSTSAWAYIGATSSLFLAAATGALTAATSPDGVTWTSRTLPVLASSNFHWNGTYLMYCSTGDPYFPQISTDGITWSKGGKLPFNVANVNSVSWNGSLWCISNGSNVATSPDAMIWTQRTLPVIGLPAVGTNNSIFAFLPTTATSTVAAYSALPNITKFENPNIAPAGSYSFIKAA